MVILGVSFLLTFFYVLLMGAYRMGFEQEPEYSPDEAEHNHEPSTSISVIIPARNEAANIHACITSIIYHEYPDALLEIIVVDDHSEDDTAEIVSAFADKRVQCISLAGHLDSSRKINAYKKAALAAGIAQSKGTLIVTTDADCIAPPQWLRHIAAIYEQRKPAMVVAPVMYGKGHGIMHTFQVIDFMSMQGITAAVHHLKLGNMSNGANLAFRRDAYMQVNGYTGTEHLASGDDYLLMMKINRSIPGSIVYLKSERAIITTPSQPDWKSFLMQRIRWASKSGKYPDVKLTAILIFVYLYNCSFLVLAIAGFFDPLYFQCLAVMLIIKLTAELSFLTPVARFFDRRQVLKYMPLLQPLHICYIILAGFMGFVGVYQWKGRRVR